MMLYVLNISIYALIFLFCQCIAFTMATWCYYIEAKRTTFAFWFFLGVAGIKASFGLIALANILAMWFDGAQPPLWTLGPKVVLLMFLCLHFYLLQRARPSKANSIDLGLR